MGRLSLSLGKSFVKAKSKLFRKDVNLKRIVKNINDMDNVRSKVGFPENRPVKSGEFRSMSEVATIAMYNEHGTENIPARPFMQTSFETSRKGVSNRLHIEGKKVVNGRMDAMTAIGRVGEYLTSETKKTVRNWSTPPNAPSTIRQKKGVNNPLVDTGQMVNTITHVEVRHGI